MAGGIESLAGDAAGPPDSPSASRRSGSTRSQSQAARSQAAKKKRASRNKGKKARQKDRRRSAARITDRFSVDAVLDALTDTQGIENPAQAKQVLEEAVQ